MSVGGLGGAAVAGTVGSAWGVAAATVCGSAVWWLQLRSALRERHHESHPRSEDLMTAQPRLSIGLPVYNGEEYLAESLDALLGQTYEDFELVISDNASTDGTQEICREYAARDSRIRYLRLPRNIGAAPNHNYVFDRVAAASCSSGPRTTTCTPGTCCGAAWRRWTSGRT